MGTVVALSMYWSINAISSMTCSASTCAKGFYPEAGLFPPPPSSTRPPWAGDHVQSLPPVSIPVALYLLAVPPAVVLRQAAQGHLPTVAEAQQEEGGVLGRHAVWSPLPGLALTHHHRLLEWEAGPGRRDCGWVTLWDVTPRPILLFYFMLTLCTVMALWFDWLCWMDQSLRLLWICFRTAPTLGCS